MADPVIMWFRQDLRIADNAALAAATAGGGPVLAVFVLDEVASGTWGPGGASRWWLHHSLRALDESLHAIGSRLILRRGKTIDILLAIASESGARSIHLTRGYEPHAARLEQALNVAGSKAGVGVHRFPGALLKEPEALQNRSGQPFRVFTPFWRALLASERPRASGPAPHQLKRPKLWPRSDNLDDWLLVPRKPDWADGLRATWEPGEAGAARRLTALVDNALASYATGRDRPDRPGTSMLSPHLHFGEVSPNQCWHAVHFAMERDPSLASGAASFLRELGWREFSTHLLHHWPTLPETSFRPEFEAFPWEPDDAERRANLAAWSRGETGYPIVDAGMRQLWQTGWMHNRVRMIAASFLTKHLLVPWQTGARWFWDTLVDADLANNAASWQWVAGSGADAAPYFRIFNPILQGQKFDPDGAYVRRYVPEIARLPVKFLHAPWTAPTEVLATAGVSLGQTYPLPIVGHEQARRRALAAYATIKRSGVATESADGPLAI